MIGSEYLPYEHLTVAPTQMSVAEYCIASDTILLWGWTLENVVWFAKPGETFNEMITRIIAHEEMHRILLKLEGDYATFAYDNITNTNLEDLV